jgi:glycosyltransferase involved in cell wall biosynthesis
MARVTATLLLAPDVPPAPGVMAAGPGIRYAEMAAALRREGIDVLLAAPEDGEAVWEPSSIDRLAAGFDAVVLPQGHAELGRQVARRLPKDIPVVVDCYAPGIVENLSLSPEPQHFPGFRTRTVELLERGDLFLVANAPQRLYTVGLLSAIGRLNPLTYREAPILTVPYGIPPDPPGVPAHRVARGVLVPPDAPLVVWYGGVYPWFDGVTAVRGFAGALAELPEAWLIIVGGRHPRAHAPDTELVRALGEARVLGVEERVVEAPWGPYAERAAWYAEADVAICLHHSGIETELAQRTRLVDYVWGRVPFVCSEGDVVGEWASRGGAAIAAPIGDADAVTAALLGLLRSPEARQRCRSAAEILASQITWPVVLEPLVAWLRHPRLAPDRFAGERWRDAVSALVRAAIDARR